MYTILPYLYKRARESRQSSCSFDSLNSRSQSNFLFARARALHRGAAAHSQAQAIIRTLARAREASVMAARLLRLLPSCLPARAVKMLQ